MRVPSRPDASIYWPIPRHAIPPLQICSHPIRPWAQQVEAKVPGPGPPRHASASTGTGQGDADTTAPLQHARLCAEAIPGAQLHIHPGHGHFSILAIRGLLAHPGEQGHGLGRRQLRGRRCRPARRGAAASSAATWQQQFTVDAVAAALLIAELAGRHIARGADWGRIIGLTSGGEIGFPEEVSYGAAKAAQVDYTMSAAVELAPYGITVNMIHPPVTDTGWVTAKVREAMSRPRHCDHAAARRAGCKRPALQC
jgi:NAD(P)-dependent dehydrogenase (short-subunit alcohol dehydrogenase family)